MDFPGARTSEFDLTVSQDISVGFIPLQYLLLGDISPQKIYISQKEIYLLKGDKSPEGDISPSFG